MHGRPQGREGDIAGIVDGGLAPTGKVIALAGGIGRVAAGIAIHLVSGGGVNHGIRAVVVALEPGHRDHLGIDRPLGGVGHVAMSVGRLIPTVEVVGEVLGLGADGGGLGVSRRNLVLINGIGSNEGLIALGIPVIPGNRNELYPLGGDGDVTGLVDGALAPTGKAVALAGGISRVAAGILSTGSNFHAIDYGILGITVNPRYCVLGNCRIGCLVGYIASIGPAVNNPSGKLVGVVVVLGLCWNSADVFRLASGQAIVAQLEICLGELGAVFVYPTSGEKPPRGGDGNAVLIVDGQSPSKELVASARRVGGICQGLRVIFGITGRIALQDLALLKHLGSIAIEPVDRAAGKHGDGPLLHITAINAATRLETFGIDRCLGHDFPLGEIVCGIFNAALLFATAPLARFLVLRIVGKDPLDLFKTMSMGRSLGLRNDRFANRAALRVGTGFRAGGSGNILVHPVTIVFRPVLMLAVDRQGAKLFINNSIVVLDKRRLIGDRVLHIG